MEPQPAPDNDSLPCTNQDNGWCNLNDDFTWSEIPEYTLNLYEEVDLNWKITDGTQWLSSPDTQFNELDDSWYNSESVKSVSSVMNDFDRLMNTELAPMTGSETASEAGIMTDTTGTWLPNQRYPPSVDASEVLYLEPSALRFEGSPPAVGDPGTSNTSPAMSNFGAEHDRKSYPARRLAPASAQQNGSSTKATTPPKRKPQSAQKLKPRRPCDARKESRKADKPEKCNSCDKSFAWPRERNRHYVIYHRSQAVVMGISIERFPCPYQQCVTANNTFRRKDYLKKAFEEKTR